MKKVLLIFAFLTYGIIFNFEDLKADDIQILSQPISLNECSGKPASLLVDAVSKSKQKLNYRWYKDNKIILDANQPILSFDTLQFYNSGEYYCRISSSDYTEFINTETVAVYVMTKTSITDEPRDYKFYYFDNTDTTIKISFRVHAADIADSVNNVKIQWFWVKTGATVKIDGSTDNMKKMFSGGHSNILSIYVKKLPDFSQFFAVVTGMCGVDTTRIATIETNVDPLKWIQPEDIKSCEGKNAVLHAEVDPGGSKVKINYQWLKNGDPLTQKSNLHGINSPYLTFDPLTYADAGDYNLKASIDGTNYTTRSYFASIKIYQEPKIISFWSDTTGFICYSDESGKADFSSNGFILNLALLLNSGDSIRTDDDFHKYYTYSSIYATRIVPDNIEQYIENNPVTVPNEWRERSYCRKYWATVRGFCGSVTSDTITLNNRDISWSLIPIEPQRYNTLNCYTQCKDKDIVLESKFYTSLNRNIIYQWYKPITPGKLTDTGYVTLKDDERISGTQTSQLIIKNAQLSDNNVYLLRATLEGSDTLIDTHFLTTVFDSPLEIIQQPTNKTFFESEENTFLNFTVNQRYAHVNVYFKSKQNDTWKFLYDDWANKNGKYFFLDTHGGTDSYYIYPGHDGYYYAEIANPCGEPVYTDTVKITVIPKNEVGIISGLTETKVETNDVYFYHTPPFPLPATNLVGSKIYWNSNYKMENMNFKLYNLYGDKIENPEIILESLNNFSANLTWNCADFEPGIYFIRISLAGENMSIPVIVAR